MVTKAKMTTLVLEALEKLTLLDQIKPIATAQKALAAERVRKAEAENAFVQTQSRTQTMRDPLTRHRSGVALIELENAIAAARERVKQAERGVIGAVRMAYTQAAPTINARHTEVVTTQLAPALRELERICDELIAIERVRGSFMLSDSAVRLPLDADMGAAVGETVRRWLTNLPSAAAARTRKQA
jgi:hypothetical protein